LPFADYEARGRNRKVPTNGCIPSKQGSRYGESFEQYSQAKPTIPKRFEGFRRISSSVNYEHWGSEFAVEHFFHIADTASGENLFIIPPKR
jgi:hypothetical protein